MLVNGINTSPLLFAEEHDHFHCIFRGEKRLVLVDTKAYPDVRQVRTPTAASHEVGEWERKRSLFRSLCRKKDKTEDHR